jgi:hypothetical protein
VRVGSTRIHKRPLMAQWCLAVGTFSIHLRRVSISALTTGVIFVIASAARRQRNNVVRNSMRAHHIGRAGRNEAIRAAQTGQSDAASGNAAPNSPRADPDVAGYRVECVSCIGKL